MGEGMDTDAAIFPFISSANIACGYHAGDESTMRRAVEWALHHHVAIGAHPSYPDGIHFGRIDLLDSAPGKGDRSLRYEDLTGMLYQQLDRLQKICHELGTGLQHVKPHGALYNRAAKDPEVSDLICQSIAGFDPSLLLYGLSGSEMKKAADRYGLSFVSEVFADRTYRQDGSLTPRSEPDALIDNPDLAVRQVTKMIREGRVEVAAPSPKTADILPTMAGPAPLEIPILAETVCIHGDGAHAVEFARMIHGALLADGLVLQQPLRTRQRK